MFDLLEGERLYRDELRRLLDADPVYGGMCQRRQAIHRPAQVEASIDAWPDDATNTAHWIDAALMDAALLNYQCRFSGRVCKELMLLIFPRHFSFHVELAEFRAKIAESRCRVLAHPTFLQECGTLRERTFESWDDFNVAWKALWYAPLWSLEPKTDWILRAQCARGKPHKSWNPRQRWTLYELARGRCWICDEQVEAGAFHLDHVIPVSRGGPDEEWNLAVAHPRCNTRRAGGVAPQASGDERTLGREIQQLLVVARATKQPQRGAVAQRGSVLARLASEPSRLRVQSVSPA